MSRRCPVACVRGRERLSGDAHTGRARAEAPPAQPEPVSAAAALPLTGRAPRGAAGDPGAWEAGEADAAQERKRRRDAGASSEREDGGGGGGDSDAGRRRKEAKEKEKKKKHKKRHHRSKAERPGRGRASSEEDGRGDYGGWGDDAAQRPDAAEPGADRAAADWGGWAAAEPAAGERGRGRVRSGRTPTPSRSRSRGADAGAGAGQYVRGRRPASPRGAGAPAGDPAQAGRPGHRAGEPGWLYVSGLPDYMTDEQVRCAANPN